MPARSLPPVPNIEGHLTASGKQLAEEQKKNIDSALGKVQEEAKVDLAILVMDQPLGEGTLQQMADQTFHTWNIGKSWDGGGALLVVSHDASAVAVAQTEAEKPFNEKQLSQLKSIVLEHAARGQLYQGLSAAAERSRRLLRRGGKPFVSAPPLKRDIEGATRYGFGALVVVILALITRRSVPR